MEERIHKNLIKYFKSLKGVHSVKSLIELPNKYGDNASYFTLIYEYEDKYNYTKYDVNVNYSRGIVFVRNKGYIPFKSFSDIKKIVDKTFRK